MALSRERLHSLGRFGLIGLNLVAAMVLVATIAFIVIESRWSTPRFVDADTAFREGSIGTELMPLPAALALPTLAPHHFQPAGPDGGDWIEQFGFMRDPDDAHGLPVGFTRSDYRPKSAAPSPVEFVALTCVLCHSTSIQAAGSKQVHRVVGPGSVALNLFAWIDAIQAALLERETGADDGEPPSYRISADQIIEAWEQQTGESLGLAEALMTRLWLSQFRAQLEAGLPRFGEPYGHGASRDPAVTPTGPTRTLPFRTLVRRILNRPGNDMPVYTKIATVFSQDRRPRAQFDGTIADLNARSSVAAFAAGATVVNLANDEIAYNVRVASAYTGTLRAPGFETLFPEHAGTDRELLAQGRAVYRRHCLACHGDRTNAGGWETGSRSDTIIGVDEIGTDPVRVTFRHYGELPGRIHALFDEEHPFNFPRDLIFPAPGEEDDLDARGYVAGAIDGAYLRAPYLHNASVLTLAELINLEPRRKVFFRGRNKYDPQRVGFASPERADADHYFRFDTGLPGNDNGGHDYPWAYDDPARSEEDLHALLAYLKTL